MITSDYAVIPYSDRYLSSVLKLIDRSDSTNRDEVSWRGLGMTGILAEKESQIVGALPFEPRRFLLGAGKKINALWISGAHVDPEFRRKGIGTQMDISIKGYFSPQFDAVFALRSNDGSDAYRWYRRIGYYVFGEILSLRKSIEHFPQLKVNSSRAQLWGSVDQIRANETKLFNCFSAANSENAGFVERDANFWSRMLQFHYYKKYYTYQAVGLMSSDKLVGYFLLGRTSIKDQVERFDILEYVLPDDDEQKHELINAVLAHAAHSGVQELRGQFSSDDKQLAWFQSLGFSERWRTNVLGRMLDPFRYFADQVNCNSELKDRFKITMKTPLLGKEVFGSGRTQMEIELEDQDFHLMLANRLINSIVPSGIQSFFQYRPWKFFQFDYV